MGGGHPSRGLPAYTRSDQFYHLACGPTRRAGIAGVDMQLPFRHLFTKPADSSHAAMMQRWADQHGHEFRRVRDADGCVIEGSKGLQEWRIEWGDSQRSYIEGHELRLIADLGLPKSLMVMVLNRVLMAAMEKEVYNQYVNDVQTRIDTDTPPEMRWLVMYPKLDAADMGGLKERFEAVSSAKPWALQWLTPSLREVLRASIEHVRSDQPFVLVISRGRLILRTPLPQADAERLTLLHGMFEHALLAARQVGDEWQHAPAAASIGPVDWAHSEELPTTAGSLPR